MQSGAKCVVRRVALERHTDIDEGNVKFIKNGGHRILSDFHFTSTDRINLHAFNVMLKIWSNCSDSTFEQRSDNTCIKRFINFSDKEPSILALKRCNSTITTICRVNF